MGLGVGGNRAGGAGGGGGGRVKHRHSLHKLSV